MRSALAALVASVVVASPLSAGGPGAGKTCPPGQAKKGTCTTTPTTPPSTGGTSPGSSSPGSTSPGSSSPSIPSPSMLSRQWDVCGGPTVMTLLCASVRVEVLGTNTTVFVKNLSGDPAFATDAFASSGQWVLTAVGFDGIPNAAGTFTTATGATSGPWWQPTPTSTAPTAWSRFDDTQHGGGVNVDIGIDNGSGMSGGIASSCAPASSLPGGSNHLWMTPVDGCGGYTIASANANGGWFESSFTTVEAWDPTGNDVAMMFKGQNGPGGGSYECVVGGADPRGDCFDSIGITGTNETTPGAVVPEPRTFVLMATGLAGFLIPVVRRRWSFASLRRRHR